MRFMLYGVCGAIAGKLGGSDERKASLISKFASALADAYVIENPRVKYECNVQHESCHQTRGVKTRHVLMQHATSSHRNRTGYRLRAHARTL